MKFTRMGHAAIHVKDIERGLRFYRDVLGFESNWVGDADWANLKLGGDDLSLVREAGHRHPPHLGLRVASEAELEHAHRELSAKGVAVEAITPHRDGSVSFYFTDPDGNILEALWDPTGGSPDVT